MLNRYFVVTSVCTAAVLSATTALAQSPYVGLSYGIGSRELSFFGPDSDITEVMALVGLSFDIGQAGLYAALEAETALSVSPDTSVQRFRGVILKDFADFNIFAAVGHTTLNSGYSGLNYGVGGAYSLTDKVDLRLEYLVDDTEDTNGYTWDQQQVRAGLIYKF